MKADNTITTKRKKSCVNCGAELTYNPGTDHIICGYCNHKEVIQKSEQSFKELDLYKYLSKLGNKSHSTELSVLHCKNCGATQHIEQNYKSLNCVYCSSLLIIEDMQQEDWIVPNAIVPFEIDQDKAHQIFKKWVAGLWWGPNKLKKASINPEFTKGLYVPYWTFDAQLHAKYIGERGDYYYVTTTVGSRKNRRRVQKRKTRWRAASGTINGLIDDTLVSASHKTNNKLPSKVCNWQLKKLQSFDNQYLAGFVTEKYTLSLKEGHAQANEKAQQIAKNWIRRDIGGDTQRIHSVDMELAEETFKHILLPVYISSYTFNGKKYSFYVNGQTSSIYGKRPYSYLKIVFAILSVLILFFTIYYFTK